jgi:hypothetical protein
MAIHSQPSTMLKESLKESLEAAKYCSQYQKKDSKWGDYNTGGCLGYPAAILLFSIIDSIGSYFRKNQDFKILIDSKMTTIDSEGWQHFKILNSKYFNQNLSEKSIKTIYSKSRSNLIHNLVLGKNQFLTMNNESWNNGLLITGTTVDNGLTQTSSNINNIGDKTGTTAPSSTIISGQAFAIENDTETNMIVSIEELCKLCETAINEFFKDIDNVVPNSKQGKYFN